MDGFDKFLGSLIGVVVLLNVAFWVAVIYILFRVLTHYGILS
jgi:hypothetical protein